MNTTKIQFIIGDGQPLTPINGQNEYSNSYLVGKSFSFYINGKGFMFEGVDYTFDYIGSLKLLGTALFCTGEQITILIFN